MLRIFYGTDTLGVRQAALAQVAAETMAGHTVTTISAETYEPDILQNALGAHSLFGERTCYVIDTPKEHPELSAAVLALTPELVTSENVFILITGPILAEERKRYVSSGAELNEQKAAPAAKVNHFALAEALARRDKKSLWLEFQAARARGASSEEIAGQLWWQLKALRLAACTQSAAAAGMNEFPYQKAKQALRNYSLQDIAMLADSLLTLYHDGHAGLRELDLALEAWVLRV